MYTAILEPDKPNQPRRLAPRLFERRIRANMPPRVWEKWKTEKSK